MNDQSQTGNQIERIEKRIDPEVSGGIALSSASGAVSILPKNMGEMMEFAKMMAVSGPCVRPQFRGNPGACLAIALQAFRTGADPFAVANKAYITENRGGDQQIAYEAQYINAVLNNSNKLARRLRAEYSGEGSKRKCLIVGHIVGEDKPLEYESPTIEAIAVKNSPLWKSDPDQQLYYYSSRAFGRRYLPEVLLGMYTPDEVRGEIIDISPEPPPTRSQFLQQEQADRHPIHEPVEPPDDGPSIDGLPEDLPEGEEILAEIDRDPATGYTVAFPDGTFKTYGPPISAQIAMIGAIQDGAKAGFKGLVGVWSDNAGLVKTLKEDGHDDLVHGLHEVYTTIEGKLRGDLERRMRADKEPSSSPVSVPQKTASSQPADNPQPMAKSAQPTPAGDALPKIKEVRYGPGPGRGVNWRLTVDKMLEEIRVLTPIQMTSWRQINDQLLRQMDLSWKEGSANVNKALEERAEQLK